MHVARQRLLCIEIFKTLNHLNPPFMQSIFELRSSNYSLRNANNLAHFRPNQTSFGSKSLNLHYAEFKINHIRFSYLLQDLVGHPWPTMDLTKDLGCMKRKYKKMIRLSYPGYQSQK